MVKSNNGTNFANKKQANCFNMLDKAINETEDLLKTLKSLREQARYDGYSVATNECISSLAKDVEEDNNLAHSALYTEINRK